MFVQINDNGIIITLLVSSAKGDFDYSNKLKTTEAQESTPSSSRKRKYGASIYTYECDKQLMIARLSVKVSIGNEKKGEGRRAKQPPVKPMDIFEIECHVSACADPSAS